MDIGVCSQSHTVFSRNQSSIRLLHRKAINMPKKKSTRRNEPHRKAEPPTAALAPQVVPTIKHVPGTSASGTSASGTTFPEWMKPKLKPSLGRRIWTRCRSLFKSSFVGFLVLSPFITYITCYRRSLQPAQFTVDRRERVVKGSGDSTQSYYLVWSQEGEVFTVNDSWSFLSWDSSDRYGKLHERAKIKAKVASWRVPFLSWYRNVIVIEAVDPGVDL
jgi:hypothetical protein